MIDTTVSLGNVFTIGAVIFSAGGFYVATRIGMNSMSKAIGVLTEDVKELNKLMTSVAVQNQRLDNVGERLNMVERRYDELRRGEGLINR
jgi:hypothetical protein